MDLNLYRLIFLALLFNSFLINAQSYMAFPEKKEFYSDEYYEIYLAQHEKVEKIIKNPDTHWWIVNNKYWSKFLWYFKACTDDPAQILPIFKECYNHNKHHFAARFIKMMPFILEENGYLTTYYKEEFPKMEALCQEVIAAYDQELVRRIADIEEKDQRYRDQEDELSVADLEEEEQWEKQLELDSLNFVAVQKIIEEVGYPGITKVGLKYEDVAFQVIQHAGLEAIEKYMPLMEQAIEERVLDPRVYPFLFDRMKMLKREPQHFGTQYFTKDDQTELYELYDKENVNERRRKYLLPNIKM